LEVKAVGNPKPTVRWYKQGAPIVPNKDFQVENFEDGTSVLTIMEVFPDDVGEISCEVQNPLGVDQTITELQVLGTDIMSFSIYDVYSLLYFEGGSLKLIYSAFLSFIFSLLLSSGLDFDSLLWEIWDHPLICLSLSSPMHTHTIRAHTDKSITFCLYTFFTPQLVLINIFC